MGLSLLTEADARITFIVWKRGQQMGATVFQALDAPHIRNHITWIAFDFAPFLIWQVFDFVYNRNHFLS